MHVQCKAQRTEFSGTAAAVTKSTIEKYRAPTARREKNPEQLEHRKK